jgi:hypothetical protein
MPRLKTYIVPVVHVLEFGCEVRVQARNRPEASRLALKKDAEMASGDGYDWDRSELVRTRRGSWDKITVVGYFQGDKTRNSLTQKAEQSDTK